MTVFDSYDGIILIVYWLSCSLVSLIWLCCPIIVYMIVFKQLYMELLGYL